MLANLIERIFNHLTNWGIFWFGFLFFGSIFGAILSLIFSTHDSKTLILTGYFLGMIFGLVSNYKKWSWIN